MRRALLALLLMAPACAQLAATAARPEMPACGAAVAEMARATYEAARQCAPLASPPVSR